MRKFILKTLAWSTATLCCGILVLFLIDHRFVAGPKKLFLEQKANKQVDLMVIGSSRAAHTINPRVFDPGFRIYNAGMDGHGLPSNYLLLKLMIEKYGYTIGHVMLSADEFTFNGSVGFTRKFRDDFFVNDIADKEVYEAYKTYRGETFASILKNFPQASVLAYSDLTKIIKSTPFLVSPLAERSKRKNEAAMEAIEEAKGYEPIFPKAGLITDHENTRYIIEEDDLAYFQKLVQLCRRHNIKLSLFRAPILHCASYHSADFDRFITSFAKHNHIAFYDYKCSYQLPQYYFDNTHVTDSISQLVSRDISQKLHPVLAENRKKNTLNKSQLLTMLQ